MMPTLKQKMTQGPDPVFAKGSQLADLLGKYVDESNVSPDEYSNPTFRPDPRYREFLERYKTVYPEMLSTQQFGVLQNPPQYRGIRFILPESGGGYQSAPGVGEANAVEQALRGEMIVRGYPVLGGVGQLFGRKPGFNPIGFGQR